MNFIKPITILSFFLLGFSGIPGVHAAEGDQPIEIKWIASDQSSPPQTGELKSWQPSEILKLKSTTLLEPSQGEGKRVNWKGPLLSEFIKEAMKSLPLSQQAAVDLILFKSREGGVAAMPRWLLTKYPVLIARAVGGRGTALKVVLPLSSKPAIRKESLPLSTYGIADIVQIELASYSKFYGGFYLKKRSDPLAMMGEKLFVQNCTSCHSSTDSPPDSGLTPASFHPAAAASARPFSVPDLISSDRTKNAASMAHPETIGSPKLSDREIRAFSAYLDALRIENTPAQPLGTTSAASR